MKIRWDIAIIFVLVAITNLTVILDIPILRQVVGYVFLTILPGYLLIKNIKINKLNYSETIVLSIGLSISLAIFYGLIINNILYNMKYVEPLSTSSLIISYDILLIILIYIYTKIAEKPEINIRSLFLTTVEKALLIIPISFISMAILGTYFMNAINDNRILMGFWLLIGIYVVLITLIEKSFPVRLYPIIISLIGISIPLTFALRSNYIIGMDRHLEFYFFQIVANNQCWDLSGESVLDACLSISLLPTIYLSILNLEPEMLCRCLIPSFAFVIPLSIYIISSNYVKESYAFLASFFYMSQYMYLNCPGGRTTLGIIFISLIILVIFSDHINTIPKKIMLFIFISSCIVSHYSTTYLFLFIFLAAYVYISITTKLCQREYNKCFNIYIIAFLLGVMFVWYSQITQIPFSASVGFFKNTYINLLIDDALRRDDVYRVLGEDIYEKGIPQKIEFILTWQTLLFMAFGFFATITKYNTYLHLFDVGDIPGVVRSKLDPEYVFLSFNCLLLLLLYVVLPYVSIGYDIQRIYSFVIVIISIFFVIGGAHIMNILLQIIHNLGIAKELTKPKRLDMLMLIILIAYFFCGNGVIYNIFGEPKSIVLNSDGLSYDEVYIHDQDSFGAKWLSRTMDSNKSIATDYFGPNIFLSQAKLKDCTYRIFTEEYRGYTYLRYVNNVKRKLMISPLVWEDLLNYKKFFIDRSEIYDNGDVLVFKHY